MKLFKSKLRSLRLLLAMSFSMLFILYTVIFNSWAGTHWVDLTHPFDQNTIYWPTSKPFQLDILHKGLTKKGFWYEANNFSAAEHGGTHIDAPTHFAKGKWSVDQIPLNRLIGDGVKIDVSLRVQSNSDYLITEQDFLKWENQNGRIPEGSIVLVSTGWEIFWPEKKKYLGTAKYGDVANLHFPGFNKKAALFLTRKRKISSIGIDTPSLDFGQSIDFPAHQIFGEANIPGFENLYQLDLLPITGFRIIALPMKISHGSGGPLRIIAEVD